MPGPAVTAHSERLKTSGMVEDLSSSYAYRHMTECCYLFYRHMSVVSLGQPQCQVPSLTHNACVSDLVAVLDKMLSASQVSGKQMRYWGG
jgi:hypothetical protein